MKPLGPIINNKKQSCKDITTDCVIWDGPNIDVACLNVQIHKGDSITPIMYNSFKNLCLLIEALNIKDIDLQCLNELASDVTTIRELFDAIILKLCSINGLLDSLNYDVVENNFATVPPCLYDVSDKLTVTKFLYPEVYTKIAYKICEYLNDLSSLNDVINLDPNSYINTQIAAIESQIAVQCSPVTYTVSPTCINQNSIEITNITTTVFGSIFNVYTTAVPHGLSSGDFVNVFEVYPSIYNFTNEAVNVINPTQFSIAVTNFYPAYVGGGYMNVPTQLSFQDFFTLLESTFCDFKKYLGTVTELQIAVAYDCPDLGNLPRLSNTGIMSDIYGWIDTPVNVGQSVNNLWLTICDLRSAISNLQKGCCEFSPCLSFEVGYDLTFDPNNQFMTINFAGYCTVSSLDRLTTWTGVGPVPAQITTDFPVIDDVIIEINDGTGPTTILTNLTILQLMSAGTYQVNYPVGYDYTSPTQTLSITFGYKWENPLFPSVTNCDVCDCCCTYNLTNSIY